MKNTKFINGIKFICCLMIIIGHIYNYIGGRTIWGIRLVGGMGAKAVDIFFFLTAFLTMYSLLRNEISAFPFIKKRFVRLYPAYFVVLGISFLTAPIRSKLQENVLIYLTGNHIGAFDYAYQYIPRFPKLSDMLQHCFLIHGIFTNEYGTSILGPLWTMSIEWFYYLILAVVICFGFRINLLKERRGQLVLYLLYLLSIIGGFVFYLLHDKTDMQQTLIRNIPIFIMGMLITLGYLKIISYRETIVVSLVGLCYIFLLNPSQNWLSCGILVVVLILLMINDRQRDVFLVKSIDRFLSGRWMEKGCRLSYSLYLCHMLVIPFGFALGIEIAKRLHLDNRYFITIGATISMLGSFFCAYLLNKLIEQKTGKLI